MSVLIEGIQTLYTKHRGWYLVLFLLLPVMFVIFTGCVKITMIIWVLIWFSTRCIEVDSWGIMSLKKFF